MSRFSGRQDFSGAKGPDRPNKGVMHAYRQAKRVAAIHRQNRLIKSGKMVASEKRPVPHAPCRSDNF